MGNKLAIGKYHREMHDQAEDAFHTDRGLNTFLENYIHFI